MDPLPIPTLRPSTPASMRFFACAAVTTEIKLHYFMSQLNALSSILTHHYLSYNLSKHNVSFFEQRIILSAKPELKLVFFANRGKSSDKFQQPTFSKQINFCYFRMQSSVFYVYLISITSFHQ